MFAARAGRQIAAVAVASLCAGCMWFYVQRIVVPHQEREAAQKEQPRGNLSDLYPRWLGSRELLLRGRDPYSVEVTREIQRGYWGRELDPTRAGDPKDQQGFAYPVYVAFLLAPTVRLDFAVVHPLYFWWSTGFTILSVFVWRRALGLVLPLWQMLTAVLLLLGSYPFLEAFSVQQPLLVVALILAGSFLAWRRGWLFLAGALLALATVKPQVALLPVILMLFWVSADWRQRQRWFWGFASVLLVLLGASEYVLPGWIFRFYGALRAYSAYMAGSSFLDWYVSPRWSGFCRVVLVLPIVRVCWKSRRESSDSLACRRALCLALVTAICIAPNFATYNQVLLLPSLFLIWDKREMLRNGTLLARNLTKIIAALVIWPWIACGILVVAKLGFHAEQFVRLAWQLPLYTTLSLPIAILALLLVWPVTVSATKQTLPVREMLA
jgi:hypothetical protein